jgi:hypothetical protein
MEDRVRIGDGMGAMRHRGRAVPILLLICVALVVFWEVMAYWSKRPYRPFGRTARDFASFRPAPASWEVESLPIAFDPIEPNILAYLVKRAAEAATNTSLAADASVLVRLVHGYNMRDCLRIKGFRVDLVADLRHGVISGQASPPSELSRLPMAIQAQIWRVSSSAGTVTLCVTSVLNEDLLATDFDTRSMAFPRVGTPDEVGWVARGVTMASLRHPVAGLKRAIRSQWNSSRRSVTAFLRLKQPAWASDSLFSLVSAWRGPSVTSADEERVAAHLLSVHAAMASELRAWRERERSDGNPASPSKRP